MTHSLPDAVFLDRDGVINEHVSADYVKRCDEFRLIESSAHAIRRLNDASVPVFVVSNQQGVGKGLMSESDLLSVDNYMKSALCGEAAATIMQSYYCTSLNSEDSRRRKPKPGMLVEAAEEHGFSLANSVLIGDSSTDIQAGHSAGVRATVLVLSGASTAETAATCSPRPTIVCATLHDAVDRLLRGEF